MAIGEIIERQLSAGMSLARGRVLRLETEGAVLVRLHADPGTELRCSVLCTQRDQVITFRQDDEVLIARSRDPRGPAVILGMIGKAASATRNVETVEDGAPDEDETHVSARRVMIQAGDELTLACGEAVIKITSDGKILIRGQNILSRAKGTHRIRGGSVAIN